MKTRSKIILKLGVTIAALAFLGNQSNAQVSLSSGPYSQNFDSLSSTVPGTNAWVNGTTLLGWYANTTNLAVTSFGYNGEITNTVAGTGTSTSGFLYNYGANALTDRALGSQSVNAMAPSGQPALAFGIRFTNDTTVPLTNISVSYTGEQWRDAGNTPTPVAHTLTFAYRIDNSAITNADSRSVSSWQTVASLNFVSPKFTTTASALDGNLAANRTVINPVVLSGFVLLPGQEIFFRWLDTNESGNDAGLAIDDLTISFETNLLAGATAPVITTNPASITIAAGNSATFNVAANGTQPFSYFWYATNAGITDLVGNSDTFTTNLVPVTSSGIQFYVIITNSIGSATSSVATLTVTNPLVVVTNISYLHTLKDANYLLTNTTTIFEATGTVTTDGNLVSGTSVYSFHIQDNTGGIDIFHRGGFVTDLPAKGDIVTVRAPLLSFNGLLEFVPTNANPTHVMTVISSGNPLPAPVNFDFTTIDPALMESIYEGRLVIVSNVFLGTTNVPAFTVPIGGTVFMTNLSGQVFRLFCPVPFNLAQGQPVPQFARSVRGVMAQNDGTSPFTSGYSMFLQNVADIEVGVAPPAPEPLTIQVVGSNVELSWTQPAFELQASPVVTGTYTNIPSATSPYTTPISGEQRYFRLNYVLP